MYARRRRTDGSGTEGLRDDPAASVAPPPAPATLLALQRTAGNQAVSRLAAATRALQRHGPGYNTKVYREAANVHFDRHLGDWERLLGVTTVDEVREIAQTLFDRSAQEDWVNKGGNYSVTHTYKGQKVLLAWGDGGIVSCYPKERDPKLPPKRHGGRPPKAPMGGFGSPYGRGSEKRRDAHRGTERASDETESVASSTDTVTATVVTVTDQRQVEALADGSFAVYKGFTWSNASGALWWWDTGLNSWRPRFEGAVDWLIA